MLNEMRWLAVDVAQERLWKQTAALAIAAEIARMEGDFNLKQPPAACRQYSDEIRQLRQEAAEAEKSEGKKKAGRRSKAAALPPSAVLLEIDAENDPGLRELEDGIALLRKQAKDIGEKADIILDVSERAPELFMTLDAATVEKIDNNLFEIERQRLINEEARYRSYRMEYEAALASHQLAIAEQQAAANAIDAFDVGQAPELDLMDDGLLGPPENLSNAGVEPWLATLVANWTAMATEGAPNPTETMSIPTIRPTSEGTVAVVRLAGAASPSMTEIEMFAVAKLMADTHLEGSRVNLVSCRGAEARMSFCWPSSTSLA
jgi:hypothetical protein